jgi:hypothetical protein
VSAPLTNRERGYTLRWIESAASWSVLFWTGLVFEGEVLYKSQEGALRAARRWLSDAQIQQGG